MGWFNDTFGFDIPGLTGPGSVTDAFFGDNGLFSNPEGAWDNFKNGQTNEANERIANENLEYQRERNEIEDSRYEEETAYNRAFAENQRDYERKFAEEEQKYQRAFAEENRDYERALQQQIFEREDTALERQASSLSSMGINPLSQNMNGLGAGQVIQSAAPSSSSAPSGASAPSPSNRGGSALHNDFKMQDYGFSQLLSSLMESANAIDNINTQGVQRDSIRSNINLQNAEVISKQLENERTEMENLLFAKKNGITKDSSGNLSAPDFKYKEQDFSLQDYENKETSKSRNQNELKHQLEYGTTDSSTWIERTATGATKQAQRALNTIGDVASDIGNSIATAAENDYNRMKNFFANGKEKINKFKNWLKNHTNSNSEMQKKYSY